MVSFSFVKMYLYCWSLFSGLGYYFYDGNYSGIERKLAELHFSVSWETDWTVELFYIMVSCRKEEMKPKDAIVCVYITSTNTKCEIVIYINIYHICRRILVWTIIVSIMKDFKSVYVCHFYSNTKWVFMFTSVMLVCLWVV